MFVITFVFYYTVLPLLVRIVLYQDIQTVPLLWPKNSDAYQTVGKLYHCIPSAKSQALEERSRVKKINNTKILDIRAFLKDVCQV